MIHVVYTSTKSNNCKDFVASLNYPHTFQLMDPAVYPKEPLLLITGTYADTNGTGALHEVVKGFLRNRDSVDLLKGVAASGNRVFGDKFALSGKIISRALDIPLVDMFELKGTPHNVDTQNRSRAFADSNKNREWTQ